MTRICVAGGTGQVGREVVRLALDAGVDVVALSRRPPSGASPAYYDGARYFEADVTTGAGLQDALQGVDVVIDCLEGRFGRARKNFADGGARLLASAKAAAVRKAVLLSIINCDQSRAAFYASKADKERAYAASAIETTVVRATQFHSFPIEIFHMGAKLGIVPIFRGVRLQTIAPADVASVLLQEALEGSPGLAHRVRTIGGPEVLTMREMAEAWQESEGTRRAIIELPLPGAMGRFLRSGLNLDPSERVGTETFESWLAKRRESL
ncbi:SDR family oxidoreductase [bacterium RCC_150]